MIPILDFIVEQAEWKQHFAWIPKKIDGQWYWFDVVYRRKIYMTEYGFHSAPNWEYATLIDILKS